MDEQKKQIDMDKTLTLVLTYPDNMVPVEMAWWFMTRGFKPQNISSFCEKGPYDVIRNKAMLMLKKHLDTHEWIIFADNDMRPGGPTDMFLADYGSEYDVVACNYQTNPMATITPEAFHMGLVRVRTSKIKELLALQETDKKPLFFFSRNADHTAQTACECSWFANRLKEVNAKVIRIGFCDHFKTPGHRCA
jgi:hypothetical protein